MTAANSTPLSDGASAVLLASEEWAKERDLPVLAYFIDGQTAAVDHVHKREGLLMAPAYAMPLMLDRIGLARRLRPLRDPRGLRRAGALHAGGLGGPWFCKERLGRDEPLGSIDREQAQRQRRLARRRAPVRRDRRPHRRRPRQGSNERRRGQRPDQHLRRRRPGRRRHPREPREGRHERSLRAARQRPRRLELARQLGLPRPVDARAPSRPARRSSAAAS